MICHRHCRRVIVHIVDVILSTTPIPAKTIIGFRMWKAGAPILHSPSTLVYALKFSIEALQPFLDNLPRLYIINHFEMHVDHFMQIKTQN